jgi:hypothetical protein
LHDYNCLYEPCTKCIMKKWFLVEKISCKYAKLVIS